MKKSITLLAALAIVGSMSAQVSKEADKLKKEKATSEQSLKDGAKKTDQETKDLRQKAESEKDKMKTDSKSGREQAQKEAKEAREMAGSEMDKAKGEMDKAKGDMRDAKEDMRDAKDQMKDAKDEMKEARKEMTAEQKVEMDKRREQANAERTRILKEYGTKVNKTEAETKRITESPREELMKLPPAERKEAMQVKTAQELAMSKSKLKNGESRISAAVEKLNAAKADGSMTAEEIEAKTVKITRAKKAMAALQEKIKKTEQSLRSSN